jgi:hypothetical protein
MARHGNPYTVALSVTALDRGVWGVCERLGDALGRELVWSCEEIRAVLSAQGRLISRLLADQPYEGFQVVARAQHSGAMVGLSRWHRSAETGALLPAEGLGDWTACAHGDHGEPGPESNDFLSVTSRLMVRL